MSGRTVFTEIGPDRDALRAEDRAAVLFDLGLGTLQLDACIRIVDAGVIAALRNWVGRSLFEAGNAAMELILAANPNRVFVSRVGRVEVYQPIPPPEGRSPAAVRTPIFFLGFCDTSVLMRRRKLYSRDGFRALTYPPHPMRDALGHGRRFQWERHEAFQTLLARYGDPQLVDTKQRVVEFVAAGQVPPNDGMAAESFRPCRYSCCATAVAGSSKQGSPALVAWLAAYDRPDEPNDAA